MKFKTGSSDKRKPPSVLSINSNEIKLEGCDEPKPEEPPPTYDRRSTVQEIVKSSFAGKGSISLRKSGQEKKSDLDTVTKSSSFSTLSLLSQTRMNFDDSTSSTSDLFDDQEGEQEYDQVEYSPSISDPSTNESERNPSSIPTSPRKLSIIKEEEDLYMNGSSYNIFPNIATQEVSNYVVDKSALFKRKEACMCRTCHSRSSKKYYDEVDEESSISAVLVIPEVSSHGFVDGSEYFILNILTLNSTKKLRGLSKIGDKRCEGFAFKWNFLKYHDNFYFNEVKSERVFNLNCQRMYVFNMSPAVYQYLDKCSIPLELYVKFEHDNYKMIGIADLRVSDSLKSPEKTFETTIEINNKLMRLCGFHAPYLIFGDLVCAYSLGGNVEKIKASKIKSPPVINIPIKGDGSFKNVLKGSFKPDYKSNPRLDEVELKAFQTGLNLTLIRNAALKITQEEISNELEGRVNWMHQELLWKLTLQENAILAGDDPYSVKWRQWKDENNAHVMYRPKGNKEFKLTNKAEFDISIVELQINPHSRVTMDETIVQLYVEYSFLNQTGLNLETPCEIKPSTDNPITYNFKRTFVIEKTDKSAKVLADMFKNNESITFTVVSEPLPDKTCCQTCIDLGSCQMNMFDLLQSSTDVLSQYFTLYDHWDDAELGKLKIIVSGIFSIRSLALHVLTPDTFNIIR